VVVVVVQNAKVLVQARPAGGVVGLNVSSPKRTRMGGECSHCEELSSKEGIGCIVVVYVLAVSSPGVVA
jgi:hypothetical protein